MLESNATIASIWDRLADSRLYAARVYQNGRRCENEHGNANIRIGITGSGQKPCYRVSYFDSSGASKVWGSFWDMGDPLDGQQIDSENWSSASMALSELKDLLEALRPKKSTP
jgi:hypothetical protein